ncbi:MAG: DUF3445 domain-containing protein [Paracoccaceae bacterium]
MQASLPFAPWIDPVGRRLPGIRPADMADWITADDAFAGQMALRDRLVVERPDDVIRMDPAAQPAAAELLDTVATYLADRPGYRRDGAMMTRPDGVAVAMDRDNPMATLARLCQDDFCILERRGDEHVLTAAVLCFPASWTLDQKFLRPLIGIHEPVASYDDALAPRVQRLFDAIRPDQVLWRANWLLYAHADLYQARREYERRPKPGLGASFLRSERQSLRRLPESGAVVFSIHTWVVARGNLTAEQEAGLVAALAETEGKHR